MSAESETPEPLAPDNRYLGKYTHGKYSTYDAGCRCDQCRAAKSDKLKALSQKFRERRLRGEEPPKHGRTGYSNWGCRCPVCKQAHADGRKESHRRWRQRNPEKLRAASARKLALKQGTTSDSAKRNGYQWTGPELEVISRADLTMKEMAFILGRTYAAVENKRRLLRSDPKTINVAGIANGGEQR